MKERLVNRLPGFYGWYVLGALFFIFAVGTIGINTLPLFYTELKNDFGWTHEQVTRPSSFLYLIIAASSPFIGLIIDRFNPRGVIFISSLGIILALFLYSQVSEIWHLMLIYMGYAIVITGAGALPSMYIITLWFKKRRGLAVGIFWVGSSFGGIVFPQYAGWLMEAYNWQVAAQGLALIALLVLVPAILLVRNDPQPFGILPDGERSSPSAQEEQAPPQTSIGLTLKEAMSQRVFYMLLIITAALWFCITALVQHQALYFADLGLSGKQSANVLSVFFGCSIFGKIVFGFLGDVFTKRSILFTATMAMTLGSIALKFSAVDITLWAYPYAIIYGLGYSGTVTMMHLIIAEYYQGPSYGRILGIFTTVDMLAGSMGIFLLGFMRTEFGSYGPAFFMQIALCLLAGLALLWVRKPKGTPSTD